DAVHVHGAINAAGTRDGVWRIENAEGFTASAVNHHSGEDREQRHHIASTRHQVRYLLGVEHGRTLRTHDLYVGSLGGHFDRFADGPDLKVEIARGEVVGRGEGDPLFFEGLEALGLDGNVVGARLNRGEDEFPCGLTGEGSKVAGVVAREGDGCPWDRLTCFVKHPAVDRPGSALWG